MQAAIYTINNGTEVAYQKGGSRVVVSKGGQRRLEVKEGAAWRAARGYFKPYFVESVKAAVK